MHSWIWTLTKLHRPPEGLRCTSKTKSILEVQNIYKAIWLWMWEVDRVIFCPVVWSIPFSYGIGLPLLINSHFDWKSSFEKCFSLAIESSFFVVKVKYNKSNGRTSINPTGGLSHAPFIEAEVGYCLPPLRAFSLRRYVRSAKLNRFYACAQPSLWGIAQSEMRHSSSLPRCLLSVWTGHAQILTHVWHISFIVVFCGWLRE